MEYRSCEDKHTALRLDGEENTKLYSVDIKPSNTFAKQLLEYKQQLRQKFLMPMQGDGKDEYRKEVNKFTIKELSELFGIDLEIKEWEKEYEN